MSTTTLHTGSVTPLDTCYQVETPEGIDLLLRPAGPLPRAIAYVIDLLLRWALFLACIFVLGALGDLGLGINLLLAFLIHWWYMVLFEVLNQGRSPGKHVLGLRVVHDDGTPIGWSASLLRNLLRNVDMLPMGYCLGFLSCLASSGFKRLGDQAAGTLVVYRDPPLQRPQVPEAPLQPAPWPLTLEEQRAIMGFAERAAGLSSARREELASILAQPLDVSTQQAELYLNGIANTLLGGRSES